MNPSSLELDLDSGARNDATAAAAAPAPAPRKTQRTLALVSVLAAFALVLLVSSGVLLQPVQVVRIKGDLLRVSKEEFVHAISPGLAPGLLRIDMAALRMHALGIPWVRDVRIRRVWPDGLDIFVVEERPFARWEAGGYVDERGRLFLAPRVGREEGRRLPALFGPPGTHTMVAAIHRRLSQEIAPFSLQLSRVGLTPRGVFHLGLRDGPHLVFPPDKDPVSRARSSLVLIQKKFAGRLHEIERIDFRYPDGFALLPKERKAPPPGEGRGKPRFSKESDTGESA